MPKRQSDGPTRAESEQFQREFKEWPEIKVKVPPDVAIWLAGGNLEYASITAASRAGDILERAFRQRGRA